MNLNVTCRLCLIIIVVLFIGTVSQLFPQDKAPADWSQFRGPNGSGITTAENLPVSFGPEKNRRWATALPPGHSSPIINGPRIFLTAFENEFLLVYCINRKNGNIIWRKRIKRDREEKWDYRNNPAAPSPVSDGEKVYVFFAEIGLLALDFAGNEKWRMPLGPFNNIYGMGASPILVGNKVILVCDQNTDSYIIAVDKESGKLIWRTERPQAKTGHCTPVVWQNASGETQVVVPGSFQLVAYAADSGEKRWWVRGLSFEMKSTPVIQDGILYINGYGSPYNQPENQVEVPTFEEMIAENDADNSGLLSQDEVTEEPAKWWFKFVDLKGDSLLDANDWGYFRAALASLNGMLAIRLGGEGDMTEGNILWQYHKAVPQLPSPLIYKNILYMINDGGIATSFSPMSGEVIKQGRLKGANDQFYASPVAADGKIYIASRRGKVAVLSPDGNLEPLAVNDLGEDCYATPAIADDAIYIRTTDHLYCFAKKQLKVKR